jgi:hypothetical protein
MEMKSAIACRSRCEQRVAGLSAADDFSIKAAEHGRKMIGVTRTGYLVAAAFLFAGGVCMMALVYFSLPQVRSLAALGGVLAVAGLLLFPVALRFPKGSDFSGP